MVVQSKIFTVQNLTQKIKEAKAIFLTDYRGLNVVKMTALRQAIKEAGGELEVTKNRLLKLAFQAVNKNLLNDETSSLLTGPTAILWANEDELAPLKTLTQFAKENELPKIKAGFLADELLSADRVNQLAQIPARNQLEAKLVGLVASPIYGLVNSLNWNRRKLVLIINNLADKQQVS
ncbi:MAG TPA: 50S ribosomal protein L10 [Candidatus Bathyarchaeia archaeon]|nr:50S ribosomal protein L10 [Candidatus Bathyarchaeia archaeon]